jgi:PAS domain S-box-containing protein
MKPSRAFGRLFVIVTLAALLVGAITILIFYVFPAQGRSSAVLLTSGLVLLLAPLAGLAVSALFLHPPNQESQDLPYPSQIFRILAEAAREGMVLADTAGRIEFVNPAMERLFGYPHGELLGKSVEQLMPEEYRSVHGGFMQRYLQTGEGRIVGTGRQVTALDSKGRRFPIYLSIGDIDTGGRRLFAGVMLDMSEQQELQRELLEIPINEQRRIGQELHDGLGQQLTGLAMLATSLLNKASKPDYELAAQLASGLQEAVSQVRALSRGLVPVEVEAGDLIHALEGLVDNLRRQTGLDISLQVRERLSIRDTSCSVHLYRIAQESLNNAIKHAGANRIKIVIGREGNRGLLSIIDDGSGFDPQQENATGLGMRIMKYRCELIDARLEVETAAAEGCRIRCYFALDR